MAELPMPLPALELALAPTEGIKLDPSEMIDTTDFIPVQKVAWTTGISSAGTRNTVHVEKVTSVEPTTKPVLLNPMIFQHNYPRVAKAKRIEGKSVIEFNIAADGKVTEFKIISSTPPGVFNRTARMSAKKARFKAGIKNGKAIEMTFQLTIKWTLPK